MRKLIGICPRRPLKSPQATTMELKVIETIFREHSKGNDDVSLNAWLNAATLARYRDWIPRPNPAETTLMDVGCYQPSIGYYFERGWRRVIGIAKEEGELVSARSYTSDKGAQANILTMDVERERIPVNDESVDSVVMMEILEHFGLDPMHALIEINRALKPNGRLVLSTPNAASYRYLYRIFRGRCPFDGLEFSGFSTNRHNRLYDCYELAEMLAAAGFAIDLCTSTSYDLPKQPMREVVFRWLVSISDGLQAMTSKRVRQRQEYIFILARKVGLPRTRYPRSFYFNEEQWPAWYSTIKKLSQRVTATPNDRIPEPMHARPRQAGE